MKNYLKLFYLLLPAVVIPVLLDSCHSGKKAARSSLAASSQGNYPPGNDSQTVTKKQKKSKSKNPPATENEPEENAIVAKYASKLGVSKKDITNPELYNFIDAWYGVPYKYAGRTHSGVDCSDFASLLFQNIYNITVTGNVTDIYKRCKPIKQSELQEGDLIFFKINSRSPSHVAIYLQNRKFVHASVHSGVVIDDLGEDYYKRYYWGAGRLLK